MSSSIYLLYLLSLLCCARSTMGDSAFVYPKPAGASPILNVGAEDSFLVQYTTTENPFEISLWLYCEKLNYFTGSCADPQTINNTHTCLFTMNFDYLASNTPTSCVFQLRLRPEVGISNMPGSPLANSTLLQIVAKSSVATFLAITTISDRSSSATAIVQPDTNFSHSSLPSLSTSYSYASSTTSSLMASSISSPKDLPKRSLSLALGLGLGIPSILAVISISILLAARRRQQRDKQKKSVKSDINAFEKPELDAQENMTIVQGEPRELRSSIDAPYEVEGDTYQVQELEDNMQRARDRIEGSIRHLQELCNEEELRQIVSELDVESVNLKLEQWDRWKII